MIHHPFTKIGPNVALILLASCGNGATSQANGETTVGRPIVTKLALASDGFKEGQPIPTQYGCEGDNKSPALRWGEPPAGTKSFALVIDDPDAPSGMFRHWGAFDIPASTRSIAVGQHVGTEVNNDSGKPGYTGPCPPRGNGVHHYHFRLFALDTDKLGLAATANVADVENAASKHALAQGELIGTYERR